MTGNELLNMIFGIGQEKPSVKVENDVADCLRINGLPVGRMIAGSKKQYMREHPDNKVFFNCDIATEKHGKRWYGDLDITLDAPKLKNSANSLGIDLFIIDENDAASAYDPIRKAKIIVKCDKKQTSK